MSIYRLALFVFYFSIALYLFGVFVPFTAFLAAVSAFICAASLLIERE